MLPLLRFSETGERKPMSRQLGKLRYEIRIVEGPNFRVPWQARRTISRSLSMLKQDGLTRYGCEGAPTVIFGGMILFLPSFREVSTAAELQFTELAQPAA